MYEGCEEVAWAPRFEVFVGRESPLCDEADVWICGSGICKEYLSLTAFFAIRTSTYLLGFRGNFMRPRGGSEHAASCARGDVSERIQCGRVRFRPQNSDGELNLNTVCAAACASARVCCMEEKSQSRRRLLELGGDPAALSAKEPVAEEAGWVSEADAGG